MISARVDEFITPEPNSGCWLWLGATRGPYGQTRRGGPGGGPKVYAHRLSYEVNVGPIPDGLLVLHRCDTPRCVNPRHLFIGTDRENALDKVAKGRHIAPHQFTTHCPQGHPYDAVNTRITRAGSRQCWTCRRVYNKRNKKRRRACR